MSLEISLNCEKLPDDLKLSDILDISTIKFNDIEYVHKKVYDLAVAQIEEHENLIFALKTLIVSIYNTYLESHTWVDNDGNKTTSHYEYPYLKQYYDLLSDIGLDVNKLSERE